MGRKTGRFGGGFGVCRGTVGLAREAAWKSGEGRPETSVAGRFGNCLDNQEMLHSLPRLDGIVAGAFGTAELWIKLARRW